MRDETRELINEQLAYYRARAAEYDDWWFRRGRYDHGDDHRQEWIKEIRSLETALDEANPIGSVLELACGTGLWTQRLIRYSALVTAVDASAEVLAINAGRVARDRVRYLQADLFEWKPRDRFDFIFFGFWLSHVPPDQFESFWANVAAWLKPGGRAFLIDSVRAQDSTAVNHVLPAPEDSIAERTLDDGRRFRIVKIFYDPTDLQQRLKVLGWSGHVCTTGRYFIYGCLGRA